MLTSRDLAVERPNLRLPSGDLTELFRAERPRDFRTVWICSGPTVVGEALRQGLVDELHLTIAPILIGNGLPFFDNLSMEIPPHLLDSRAQTSGFVELRYAVRPGDGRRSD